MGRVLIVEDESFLRTSMVRGLSRLDGVDVEDADSVDAALKAIDKHPPDLIISDIDMPERTGIEMLGELAKRGLRVPIIFVSAYLKAYGTMIPRHADIDVMEKPVGLDEIRDRIMTRLGSTTDDAAPFSVVDFLQLAGMGRRTLKIEVGWPDGSAGEIIVKEGQAWHACLGELVGPEAFARIAWLPNARVHCRTMLSNPPARNLDGSVEALLMSSAKILDESSRKVDPEVVDSARRLSSVPPRRDSSPATPADSPAGTFQEHLDAGVSALLDRDYKAAWAAFSAADQLDPNNATVQANLARLRELGHSDEGSDQ